MRRGITEQRLARFVEQHSSVLSLAGVYLSVQWYGERAEEQRDQEQRDGDFHERGARVFV